MPRSPLAAGLPIAMSTLRLSPGPLPYPLGMSSVARRALPRLGRLGAIAGLHLLLVWALLQSQGVRQVLHEARPLMVALLADVRPTPPEPVLPTPARAKPLPAPPVLPPPEITVASANPAPPPVPVVLTPVPPPMPVPAAAPVVAVVVPAPALRVVAPSAAVVSAEPRPVAAGAIRYRLPPAIEVPMASRRLGESGTVLLRVVVDVNGLPRQISLHRSSGFARLDEQALAAMRSARFQPLVEGGNAYEWLVIAPLQYDID